MDRVGTRIGYAVAIGVWSIATMGTALVHTVLGFGIARFVLGLGESGNFPASIKTVAEWFPKRERAFATEFSTPAQTSARWSRPSWSPGSRFATDGKRRFW